MGISAAMDERGVAAALGLLGKVDLRPIFRDNKNEDVNKTWAWQGWRVKEELGIGCCTRDG